MTSGSVLVHYYVGGTPYGYYRQYCCGFNDAGTSYSGYWPHVALFCPQCGDLWGRALFEYNFNYEPVPQQPWALVKRRCGGCGDGSLLLDAPLKGASAALLHYELLTLLNLYDKEIEG
jgi:hypothetical protein